MRVRKGWYSGEYLKSNGEGTELDPFIPINDVNIQDQTTPTLILPLVEELGGDVLAVQTVIGEYTFTVGDSTGMTIGDHIRIINLMGDRYYYGTILGILGNVITVDTQVDYVYVVGSEITYGNINLAVDGSITPIHFHLRTGDPSIPSSVDITRMIMVCETDTAVDLNKFGDLPALTRGLAFRRENGDRYNVWNVKSNADLVSLAYDFTVYQASNPAQARDGFAWRLTFGSSGKIGVVLRVEQDGQLGLIVQDDLTGLVSLKCIVEGHVTEGE